MLVVRAASVSWMTSSGDLASIKFNYYLFKLKIEATDIISPFFGANAEFLVVSADFVLEIPCVFSRNQLLHRHTALPVDYVVT